MKSTILGIGVLYIASASSLTWCESQEPTTTQPQAVETAHFDEGQNPTREGDVANDLQAYYEKGTQPGWVFALKKSTAENQEQREKAAKYLVALLDQAQKDELTGKAPWRATPFWGSSGENPARNLRKQIASEVAKAEASAGNLAVIRWYVDHEKVPSFQETAFKGLDKLDGRAADEFRLSVLEPVHENSAIVLAALRQIGQGKTAVPEATLKALCQHYRPSLRNAARKLNKDRDGADPGKFDQAAAMRGPIIARLMADVGALLDQPAPADAEFVAVTSKWTSAKDSDTSTTLGWLVKNDGASWEVLTPFGQREKYLKEVTEKNHGGQDGVTKNSWEKYPVAKEVERVASLRDKGDSEFELSERGGLTGQFQGHGAGIYEVTLAHWLYTAKQWDLSVRVFLPALDSLYMDRHLVDMVRHCPPSGNDWQLLGLIE